jgi:hypothetical protein
MVAARGPYALTASLNPGPSVDPATPRPGTMSRLLPPRTLSGQSSRAARPAPRPRIVTGGGIRGAWTAAHAEIPPDRLCREADCRARRGDALCAHNDISDHVTLTGPAATDGLMSLPTQQRRRSARSRQAVGGTVCLTTQSSTGRPSRAGPGSLRGPLRDTRTSRTRCVARSFARASVRAPFPHSGRFTDLYRPFRGSGALFAPPSVCLVCGV